jgi:hypothetical protein
MIKELTKSIEKATHCQIIWELEKKYTALDKETGRMVAEYNPRTGKLIIYKEEK